MEFGCHLKPRGLWHGVTGKGTEIAAGVDRWTLWFASKRAARSLNRAAPNLIRATVQKQIPWRYVKRQPKGRKSHIHVTSIKHLSRKQARNYASWRAESAVRNMRLEGATGTGERANGRVAVDCAAAFCNARAALHNNEKV